jgi:hypothetical protein
MVSLDLISSVDLKTDGGEWFHHSGRWHCDTGAVTALAAPHGWPELHSEPPQGVAARVIWPKLMRGFGDTYPRFNRGKE